jgi:cytochrome c-type biogenesis protein CcmH/NrfG
MLVMVKRRLRTPILFLVAALLLISGCGKSGTAETNSTQSSSLPTAAPTDSDFTDLESAHEGWQQALDRDPENPEALYQLGLILLLSDTEDALTHLDQAARLKPEYANGVSRLRTALRQAAAVDDPAYQLTLTGQALASIQEWRLAEIALERALEENPEYAEAWAYLGEARQHTGSEGALSALETAYSLKPDSFAANLFMSMYFRRNDQSLEAVKHLEAAIRQDPQNKDLQADLAQTLVEAGGVSRGFAILEELVEASPEDAESWLRLARLSMDNNLQVIETGLPAARQALLLSPEDPEAALLLGRGYLFLGEKVLAERFLFQALSLEEDEPQPHYYLAILYLNTGQTDKAQTHFVEADRLAKQARNLVLSGQITELLEQYFGE